MNITSLFLFKRDNGIWYVMYTDNGRKGWKSTRSRKKKDAMMFLMDFREAMKPKPRRILFSEFVRNTMSSKGRIFVNPL